MIMDTNYIEKDYFVKSLAYLFHETFEGSPDGQGSAFLDRGIGIFNTLEKLSAEQVSREAGGTTIAAQTEHTKFYLDRLCEFIGGRTEKVNWEQSWLIEEVDDAEWTALRTTVRTSYENALRCFAENQNWSEDNVGMAMGMLAHTAYHLGAIRQIAKGLK
jgi:hypothetical protein